MNAFRTAFQSLKRKIKNETQVTLFWEKKRSMAAANLIELPGCMQRVKSGKVDTVRHVHR